MWTEIARTSIVALVTLCWLIAPAAFGETTHDEGLEIVHRAEWGAKPANLSLMTRQKQTGVVIHHTSYQRQPKLTLEQKLRGLQGFSQAPGLVGRKHKPAWGDVPYHYYIDAAGRIGEGRDINYAGDTNTTYDPHDKVQIVVEGNFETEQPSPGQIQALQRLLQWLSDKYSIRKDRIFGHDHHAKTDCPGKHLSAMLPAVIDALRDR